jgi:diguanylate cyclase (GGDEF)-like protein
VPALLILTVMLVFHLSANRREARAEAAAAALEADLARARTRELEHLMALGQSLSRALTMDALHEVLWRHLPILSGNRDVWVLWRRDPEWERVTDRSATRWRHGVLESVADRISAAGVEAHHRPDGIDADQFVCYAITIGDRVAGVIGIESGPGVSEVRQTVGAAASLLGIALRNVQLFSEVRDNGLKDRLTGCFNRAHGLEALEAEIVRSRRAHSQLSVLMFDVDHFKRINDAHGHLCGDEVLSAVGARIRQVLRRSDVRCRYGGDEFMVILPDTSAAGASRVADWIRGEIEQIQIAGQAGLKLTASIGAATAQPDERADALLERADRALYAAKAAGRNCVRTSATPLRVVAQPSFA